MTNVNDNGDGNHGDNDGDKMLKVVIYVCTFILDMSFLIFLRLIILK